MNTLEVLPYGKPPLLKRMVRFLFGIKRNGYIQIYIPLPKETSQEEL